MKSLNAYFAASLPLLIIALWAQPQPVCAQEKPEAVATPEKRRNLLVDAETLIRAKQYERAFRLLKQFSKTRAGEPNYDSLLARAALNVGQPAEAVEAFKRVVAANPGNLPARIGLAQALVAVGDRQAARQEFERLDAMKLPDNLAGFVKERLSALDPIDTAVAKAAPRPSWWSGYVEGTVGYDSNVNSATSLSQVAIPAFGNLPITMSPQGTRQSDSYGSLGTGLHVNLPVASWLGVYAVGDFRLRENMSEKVFNSQNSNVRAGLSLMGSNHLLRGGIVAGDAEQNGSNNYRNFGSEIEYRYLINAFNQLSVFVNYNQFRFNAASQAQDFNQFLGGLGYIHAFERRRGNINLSVFGGGESDVAPRTATNPGGGRADGAQGILGVALGVSASPWEKVEVFASGSYQSGHYMDQNMLFMKKRIDDRYAASVGAIWKLPSDWSLKPMYVYSKTDSNIPINAYEKHEVSLTLRKDFR